MTVWEFLTDLIRKKYGITIEKDIIKDIHLPGFLITLCSKLSIKIRNYKGIDISLENPFNYDDIIQVKPKVQTQKNYHVSVKAALERARKMDILGRKSKWYLAGGPERVKATEIFRQAVIMSEQIYTEASRITAKIYREFAEHLEERH